jgi:hypothetical protein
VAAVYKIVFAGVGAAGKTEAIRTLSDHDVLSTEASGTGNAESGTGSGAVVALDYGVVTLDNGDRLHLYGTSGRDGADFMCGIVTQGSMGMVILVDGSAADPVGDLRACVAAFRTVVNQTRLVVGLTRVAATDRTIRPAIAEALRSLGLPPVVLTVDARKKRDLMLLLSMLILSLGPAPGAGRTPTISDEEEAIRDADEDDDSDDDIVTVADYHAADFGEGRAYGRDRS